MWYCKTWSWDLILGYLTPEFMFLTLYTTFEILTHLFIQHIKSLYNWKVFYPSYYFTVTIFTSHLVEIGDTHMPGLCIEHKANILTKWHLETLYQLAVGSLRPWNITGDTPGGQRRLGHPLNQWFPNIWNSKAIKTSYTFGGMTFTKWEHSIFKITIYNTSIIILQKKGYFKPISVHSCKEKLEGT